LREILFRFLRYREGEEENFFDRINRINGIKQGKRLPRRRGEVHERLHAFIRCPNIFLSFASLREIAFLREARAQAEPFNF